MRGKGPYVVIPTKRGAVPTLTPAQANAILEPEERIVATSVFDAVDFVRPCTESGMPMKEFCGLAGYCVVLTLRSSFQGGHASASSTDTAVAGDSEKGRSSVSVERWCEVVRATKPEIAVMLHEPMALSEPLGRRRRIAATRSEAWQAKMAALTGVDCAVMPSVSVGSTHTAGFIDAVPRNENALEFYRTLRALQLPEASQSMCVAHSVAALVAAMLSHVTYIECPLPWVLAEKGLAITFPGSSGAVTPATPLLDLNDNAFALDIDPISKGCFCYTCTRHNRAYLHHLLTVQEMNSDILLSTHNLFQVVQLVRAFRNASVVEREALVQSVMRAF